MTGGNQFTGITGCTGTAADTGDAVTAVRRERAERRGEHEVAERHDHQADRAQLDGGAERDRLRRLPQHVERRARRSCVAARRHDSPTTTAARRRADAKASDDTIRTPAIGIAVAVNVVVSTTNAYVGGRLTLTAATHDRRDDGAEPVRVRGARDLGRGRRERRRRRLDRGQRRHRRTRPRTSRRRRTRSRSTATSPSPRREPHEPAIADAKQDSDGSTTGIGASFALNVVNDTTTRRALADDACSPARRT